MAPPPTVTPGTVTAGASTTVAGVDCSPQAGYTTVLISLVDPSGYVLASSGATPTPDGTWQVQLSVPASAAQGTYSVYSTCDQYNSEFYYPSVPLTVAAASATPWAVQKSVNKLVATGNIASVSCGAPGSCLAVGSYVNSSGAGDALAETVTNGSWAPSKPAPVNPGGGRSYSLNSVSCTGATVCVAVGNFVNSAGYQVPLAEEWSNGTWTRQPVPAPTGGSSVVLNSVSCASSAQCMAVGWYTTTVNGAFQQVPFSELWTNGRWVVKAVPSPSGNTSADATSVSCSAVSSAISCVAVGSYESASAYYYEPVAMAVAWNGKKWALATPTIPDTGSGAPDLASVSCSSATSCMAVGFTYDQYGQVPEAELWNGSSWTSGSVPGPANGSNVALTSVSCTGPASCTAVGSYYDNSIGVYATFGEAWASGSFSVQATATPVNATYSILTSLSCVGSSCEASGSYQKSQQLTPLAELFSAGAWTQQSVPTISGAGTNGLRSVSCSPGTAVTCTAVGYYQLKNGSDAPLAETASGSKWSNQAVPMPAGANDPELTAVSCAGAGSCEAVGTYENHQYAQVAFAAVLSGGTWTLQDVVKPAGSASFSLSGISCTSGSSCTAVGSYQQASTGVEGPLVETLSGTSWTARELSGPAGLQYSNLTGVSCPAAGTCVASGWYEATYYSQKPLVAVLSGGRWRVSTPPVPSSNSYGALNAVSCGSPTSCVAVGNDGGYSYYGQVLAEVWNGSTWTPEPPPGGGEYGSLYGIACTSASACTAVGLAGQYGYPSQVPLIETWDGTNWLSQPTPPLGGSTGLLNSVSCVSAGACSAVGTETSAVTATLAEGEGGA